MKYTEKKMYSLYHAISRCGSWDLQFPKRLGRCKSRGIIIYKITLKKEKRIISHGVRLFSLEMNSNNVYVYKKEVMGELAPIIKMWEEYSGEEVTVNLGEYEELPDCPIDATKE